MKLAVFHTFSGLAFSSPAYSNPAFWCRIFQSCIFLSRIFNVPDVASESPENPRFRISHCRLTPRLQGISANIRINLILPETTVITLYILSLIVWVYLHSNFSGRLRKMHVFWNVVHNGLQGHPRSLILAPIESAYATSYWSSIITLVLSCPVSEILQVFCSEERPHPYFTRILRVFPLDYIADVVAPTSEYPKLIIRIRSKSRHVNIPDGTTVWCKITKSRVNRHI